MKLNTPLDAAQRLMVEDAIPLAKWAVKKYITSCEQITGLGYEDLLQEAYLALCKAAVTYCENSGVQFKTNEREVQVMALSRQALLSTAELIRCVEVGATDISTDEKLLGALYADEDSTCDNMPYLMQNAASKVPVTMAVANLYLRKQIIFERL